MDTRTSLIILSLVLLSQLCKSQTAEWALAYGSNAEELAQKTIQVDNKVITVGAFSGTCDFNPGPGLSLLTASSIDICISALDIDGNFLWAYRIGGNGVDRAYSVELDNNGDIIVVGGFEGTADFNPGVGTNSLTAAGTTDIFIAKYTSDGSYIAAQRLGGVGIDLALDITIDNANNIIIVGSFQGTVDFNAGPGTANLVSQGQSDAFILKLNNLLGIVFVTALQGANTQFASAVTVDSSDNIIVTGYFSGTTDFNVGSGTLNITSNGNLDAYCVKLSPAGGFIWAKTYGSSGSEYASDVVCDDNGALIISGSFENTVDFNPGPQIANRTSNGGSDAYYLKLNSNGDFQNVKTFGGSSTDEANGIALSPTNQIYGAGTFSTSMIVDGLTYTTIGVRDIFTIKMDNDLQSEWFTTYGSAVDDFGQGIAIGDSPSYYLLGLFGDSFQIQTQTQGDLTLTVPGNPNTDALIIKFKECPIITPTVNIQQCEPYTWRGVEYGESGTYTDTGISTNNCDTTFTLILEILSPSASNINQAACESFPWFGEVLTESGQYTQTLVNTAGCDSIVTLNLTILEATSSSLEAQACESFTWFGEVLTESGQYTQTLVNTAGCDSIVTLNLTILEATNSSIQEQACESFTWFGEVLTESGLYTQTLVNTAGCDSTVTLDLTIFEATNSSIQEQACESFTWFGEVLTESGQYTQTLVNAAGCDSIVTLNLTILEATNSSIQEQACESYTWFGEVLTESGQYSQTLVNTAGCDSIITLELTIISAPSFSIDLFENSIFTNTNADNFQWLECEDGFIPIEGATNSSFTPTQTGEYALEIVVSGCSFISDCLPFTYISILEQPKQKFKIYPNPIAHDFFYISSMHPISLIRIYDAKGTIVWKNETNNFITDTPLPLNLSNGTYVFQVVFEDGTTAHETVNIIH